MRVHIRIILWTGSGFHGCPTSVSAYGKCNAVPLNVTEEALALRDRAKRSCVHSVLEAESPKRTVSAPHKPYMAGIPLNEINLSPRSYNDIRRVEESTIGELQSLMESDGGFFRFRLR